MYKKSFVFAAIVVVALAASPAMAQAPDNFSFFVTSENPGDGANFGGLAGADAHCQSLAAAVGAGGKTWRAYLSSSTPLVHARDRIGAGPWFNINGVQVAANVGDLHYNTLNLSKANSLTELGGTVNGVGDTPNQHDILTGTNPDGTSSGANCENWTANGEGSATVGHLDRVGGGAMASSWNAAHASRGCSNELLAASGGGGYYYCFSID